LQLRNTNKVTAGICWNQDSEYAWRVDCRFTFH